MLPQVLVSDFFGRTTFPHYLKLINRSAEGFDANILYSPEGVIEKNSLVALSTLQKNTPVYKVSAIGGQRDAKGVWDAYGFTPKYAEINVALCGYWDDVTNEVSPERIETKKTA